MVVTFFNENNHQHSGKVDGGRLIVLRYRVSVLVSEIFMNWSRYDDHDCTKLVLPISAHAHMTVGFGSHRELFLAESAHHCIDPR